MAIELLEKVENFFLNILRKIKLGFLADIYEKNREAWRYIIFGGLAFLVNVIVSFVATKTVFAKFPEKQQVDYSNILGICVSMAFAYTTNRLFVFDSKSSGAKAILKEICSFVGCRIFSSVVEVVFMRVTVVNLKLNFIVMKFIANVIVMILNYIFSKLIIFKKGSKKDEEKES